MLLLLLLLLLRLLLLRLLCWLLGSIVDDLLDVSRRNETALAVEFAAHPTVGVLLGDRDTVVASERELVLVGGRVVV